MADDKRTIGISSDNGAALAKLVESGRFGSELDAAKFAMAFAMKSGEPPGSLEGVDTKWNVGSVDPDGRLKTLVLAFYPDIEHPFRLIEFLINRGLTLLMDSDSISVDVYGTIFSD